MDVDNISGANEYRFVLELIDSFDFYDYQSGYTFRYKTNRRFRDTNAWYHIVLQLIHTINTSDRVKVYVNGVQEKSY
jgi:hypothetical protein